MSTGRCMRTAPRGSATVICALAWLVLLLTGKPQKSQLDMTVNSFIVVCVLLFNFVNALCLAQFFLIVSLICSTEKCNVVPWSVRNYPANIQSILRGNVAKVVCVSGFTPFRNFLANIPFFFRALSLLRCVLRSR